MVLSFPIQRPDTHTSILLILLAFVFIASYFVHTSHHLTPPPVHGHSHDHHLHHAKHAHSHARTLFRTGIIHHHTRIAICFSGSLRTFATTMYWYKMKLIRPLLSLSGVEIHIFAHVWKEMEPVTSPTSSPPLSAEHLVRSIFTAHDLITHVRAITSDSIDDVKNLDEWKALEKITRGRANDKESKDPTRLLLQHWSLRAANRLKREYEISKGWMFTWVYRCRYDMLIRKAVPPFFVPTPSKPLPPLLAGGTTSAHSSPFSTLGAEPEHLAYLSQQAQDQQARLLYNISHLHTAQIWQQHWVRGVHAWMLSPNHIYVPSCEWWGGIADMFALGSSHLMDVYSERMDVKQLQIYLNTFESSWHPETYLMWSLTVYHNISVLPFPICFSILRQADDARYTELPRRVCAYGNTKYKGKGCCRIHCRKGDRHCFPDDWEKDGNANSIANPLVADIAPTTYNVTDVTAVLAECIKQYIKPADRTKYCEPKYVTELVERNAYIRKETYARCPPLEI